MLCTGQLIMAQSSELSALQQQIAAKIGPVEGARSAYTQAWSFDPATPDQVKLTVEETDKKKGKTETATYQFSLVDLDENLVRDETRRDLKFITAGIGGKQKMVDVYENGEPQNYEDEVNILVADSKAARELQELLKNAIALARSQDKTRLQFGSFEEMDIWLQDHIKDFKQEDNYYMAAFKPSGSEKIIYDYNLRRRDSRNVDKFQYTFNLADLDPNRIQLEVRGRSIAVNAKTERDQHFVTVFDDEQPDNFDDEINFPMESIAAARDLAAVLRMAIPEAVKLRTESLIPMDDLTAGLSDFSEQVRSFTQEGTTFDQKLDNGCLTTYQVQETGSNGKTETATYEWNLGDLGPDEVAIKVAGKDIYVVGEIKNGENLIQYFRDGEQRNYTDQVDIRAEGVENAKSLAFLLKQIAKGCDEQQRQMLGGMEKDDPAAWIQSEVQAFKDPSEPAYRQEIAIDRDNCSLVLTTVSPKGRGEEKMRYEVLLRNLDSAVFNPEVSGKEVLVELPTREGEDHIKTYKNEAVEKFTNSLQIRVKDVAAARSLIAVFWQLMEDCAE
ncbi:hypothetical protein CRP01_39935 [Flavilitoribacter nigricans DSM 23189 = NBRC 102662]|uniref:Uncharacterized protein n=2 Tax=Flavilitoribacter TaxID=2762562 RepID=A0A2D0MX71_FLAN2|nr:hypothetical protein CRP01_39935 [Flavilitoribacter nigricans DSM 23189 = NBRC 102662]